LDPVYGDAYKYEREFYVFHPSKPKYPVEDDQVGALGAESDTGTGSGGETPSDAGTGSSTPSDNGAGQDSPVNNEENPPF
jgi:hypothetical protein